MNSQSLKCDSSKRLCKRQSKDSWCTCGGKVVFTWNMEATFLSVHARNYSTSY